MMRTVASGWWCENCDVFEDEDQIDLLNDTCPACGCLGNSHVTVDVVTRGLDG